MRRLSAPAVSFDRDGTRERSLPRQIAALHDAAKTVQHSDQKTARNTRWDAEAHAHWIETVLADYRAQFGVDVGQHELFDRLEHASAALHGSHVPLVVDGEHHSLPLLRLDDVVQNWLASVSPRSNVHSSPWTQSPDDIDDRRVRRAHLAARSVVASYCQSLDLDQRFIPILTICNAAGYATRNNTPNAPADPGDVLSHSASTVARLFADYSAPNLGTQRRRVGIVSPFPLSETGHGAPAAVRGAVEALAHRNDVEIVTSSGQPTSSEENPTRQTSREVYRPPPPTQARRLRLVLGMLRGRPPWAIEWASTELSDQIASLIERSDVTHVEFIVMADQIPKRPGPGQPIIVIDHDPPIGGALIQLRRDPWRLRPFRLLEIQAWARAQRHAGQHATVVVVFAPEDKRIVERFVRTTPVIVAPLTIELPARALDPIGAGPATVAFFGSYRRTPNLDALHALVDRIMPLVWARRDDVHLRVIGPEPPDFVIDVDERITATGFVSDMSAALDDVAVIVAPIALGRGMRIKVLEVLAFGKAVVTTTRGAAGFPIEARSCMVVVDNDADFARAVVDLLDDPERRRQLATAGRAWAEDWLHTERAAGRYQDLHDLVDALRAGESP